MRKESYIRLKLYNERKAALETLRKFLTKEEFYRIDQEIDIWLKEHIDDKGVRDLW